MSKKVLLIVLDGYGEGKDYKYNAVTRAKTPFLDELRKKYPHTLLKTDSESVGLPKGTMGGSEVGHYTMGAGRVVFQSLEEINRSIKKRELFKKKELLSAIKKAKRVHLLGMISDAGVHSHIDHLFALMKFIKKPTYIHAITDGRDVPEQSAEKYIKQIQKKGGKIATIIGRYYAMDRDKNLDRTRVAFDLYVKGKGTIVSDPVKAIKNEYKKGTKTDYYIGPNLIDPKGTIQNDDVVIFFNYRTDRAAQITEMFSKYTKNFIAFGPYTKKFPVLYPAPKIKNNLGHFLSKKGKKQLRIAETEKYAHVTFFFNSQEKKPYKGEKRIMIPSPKVPSYADKPEMSAPKITKTLIKELPKKYDFILLNYANCDLVGHSGSFRAAKKAVETVDDCLKKLIPEALKNDYEIILTADHGNAEYMRYPNNENCASHTLNPVMGMIISDQKYKIKKKKSLSLRDIAPTILDLMGYKAPKEMTGKNLIK